MSRIDEIIPKDFPSCKSCLECSEFWYYDSPIDDDSNIFFNPKHWLGNESSIMILERECTLKELDAIGDADIYCSNCDKVATKEEKAIIIRVAKYVITNYGRNENERNR